MSTAWTTNRDRLRDILTGDRWLAVVAHPDDESFGCGSVLAHAAHLGADVTVLCATRGEAGEPAGPLPEGTTLAEVREAELRAAAAVLGVARVEVLDFVDSGFDGEPAEGTLCGVDEATVVAAIARVVAEVRPCVVVTLDGSDGHRDHVRIRNATRQALRGAECPAALFEHCLPNRLLRRWLDEVKAAGPDTVYHQLDPDVIGRPDEDVTDVLLVTHVLERREAAIAAHRSQRSPFDGLSPALRRAFLATEHLARVPLR